MVDGRESPSLPEDPQDVVDQLEEAVRTELDGTAGEIADTGDDAAPDTQPGVPGAGEPPD